MTKCTQKTENAIDCEVNRQFVRQITINANNAICFYLAVPNYRNLAQLEETLIDLMPLALLTVKRDSGVKLVAFLNTMLSSIQLHGSVTTIKEIDLAALMATTTNKGETQA